MRSLPCAIALLLASSVSAWAADTLAEACLEEIPEDRPTNCLEASGAISVMIPILEVCATSDDTTGIAQVYDALADFVMKTEEEPRRIMAVVLAGCAQANAHLGRVDVAYGQILAARLEILAYDDEFERMLEAMANEELEVDPETLCRVQVGVTSCRMAVENCLKAASRIGEAALEENRKLALADQIEELVPLGGKYAGIAGQIEAITEALEGGASR